MTTRILDRLADGAALPPGLTPATRDSLIGKWLPTDFEGQTHPHLTFDRDGSWSGSDGCNRSGGQWLVGRGGALLTTSGASTLIGCDGRPTAQWLVTATHAGFDGDVLVLVDAEGKETGRLRSAQ